jgi:hypothetical protein
MRFVAVFSNYKIYLNFLTQWMVSLIPEYVIILENSIVRNATGMRRFVFQLVLFIIGTSNQELYLDNRSNYYNCETKKQISTYIN